MIFVSCQKLTSHSHLMKVVDGLGGLQMEK